VERWRLELPTKRVSSSKRAAYTVAQVALLLFGWAVAPAHAQSNAGGAPAQSQAASAQATPQQQAEKPLDDPLLLATDDEEIPQDLFSRVVLQYDHLMFSNGAAGDRVRLSGQQTFGARNRLGIVYELPYFNIHGGVHAANGDGLGDIKLEANYLLGKTDRFSNAVRAEFTFPSGSNNVVSLGQNIVKMAYGFSIPLTSSTVFTGVLAYNKGMTARPGQQGFNTLEPDAILMHRFSKRVAAFLDWDSYYDFNADNYGQTLKTGMTIQLDRKGRWIGSPYTQFPLNHFTSSTNLKNDTGFDLTWRY
jgi:hypothetical protein